jgi:hypothetical protein
MKSLLNSSSFRRFGRNRKGRHGSSNSGASEVSAGRPVQKAISLPLAVVEITVQPPAVEVANLMRLVHPPILNGTPDALLQLGRLRVELSRGARPGAVFITTVAPELYRVIRPIPVVIQPEGDEFSANFFDANIGTAGDTQEEAFSNLRSLILDTFDSLEAENSDALGPEPSSQLAVLREFLARQEQ